MRARHQEQMFGGDQEVPTDLDLPQLNSFNLNQSDQTLLTDAGGNCFLKAFALSQRPCQKILEQILAVQGRSG